MSSWTEWNITPSGDHDEFLACVIAPWVNEHSVESWHFFWEWGEHDNIEEEVCRFRILADPADARSFRDRLGECETILHGAYVEDWYEGAHGVRGKTYAGEEGFYGRRVWEATYSLWNAHARLAVLLAYQAWEGTLERPRSMHWKRTAHLTCNQLELPDARMCLEQGHRYMTILPQLADREVSEGESRIMAALDRYLYPSEHI